MTHPFRLLHTADWHLGHTLNGFERAHEHSVVLDRLVALVVERQIDAVVIAGDVFHTPNPSGAAQRQFYETLARLHAARPAMTIVVTAGNHDSAGRLEAAQPLLARFNVHVVGSVERVHGKIDAARHLVSLPRADGSVAAHVLAVSHPTASCLPPPETDPPSIADQVRGLYHGLAGELVNITRGKPLIVTGHLHVLGATESEGAERSILVGGQHAVPVSVFPQDAAYVALGHLHKAQSIGRDTVRYSGALIPLSATEQPYVHGVTQVTFGDAAPTIEQIPLPRAVPFLRVPERGDIGIDALDPAFKALKLNAATPHHEQPFVHVRLKREGLGPGFRTKVDQIADAYPLRLIEAKATAAAQVATATTTDPLVRLSDLIPDTLFQRAFVAACGTEPTEAHLQAFRSCVAEV